MTLYDTYDIKRRLSSQEIVGEYHFNESTRERCSQVVVAMLVYFDLDVGYRGGQMLYGYQVSVQAFCQQFPDGSSKRRASASWRQDDLPITNSLLMCCRFLRGGMQAGPESVQAQANLSSWVSFPRQAIWFSLISHFI